MPIDIEKLEDSPHLLDVLLQMEDVLDSLDVYVFKNWLDGEVVEGPKVRRYWLDMTLKYPYRKMPDPRAGLRLLKHGIRVDFEKATEDTRGEPTRADENGKNGKDNQDGDAVWLVRISIPRRLLTDMEADELEVYDDEVDVDDVQDAQDGGMTDESGYGEDAANGAGPSPTDPTADESAQAAAQGSATAAPAPGGPTQ